MQEIRYRLDEIEKAIASWKPQPLNVQESDLFSLPDHLRRTYLIVASEGECNAIQVSNLTGRSRAIESSYLNQLVRNGWLSKRRDSKDIYFRPISRKTPTEKNLQTRTPLSPRNPRGKPIKPKNTKGKAPSSTVRIKCLSTDYDGTISPIKAARSESHVPLETRVTLGEISKSLPVSIVTMKDLHFVTSRTPFAHAWSGIGGLETQVGKRVMMKESIESLLPATAQAVNYAKSHAAASGLEIEEKQDSLGRTVAFCVDWRRAKNQTEAKKEADRIVDYSRTLGLCVLDYGSQPFYDVYPISPDKGEALQGMLKELSVKDGVMYLGDSTADNSAFRNCNVSVGIIHDETQTSRLNCDYFVKFEDVPSFLRTLIAKNYEFSPDYPMIKTRAAQPRQE
jgi:trehalose-phosphatase